MKNCSAAGGIGPLTPPISLPPLKLIPIYGPAYRISL